MQVIADNDLVAVPGERFLRFRNQEVLVRLELQVRSDVSVKITTKENCVP